jgi:acyl-CoA synthetase (AMP-forming)/AMP-acid ligase II
MNFARDLERHGERPALLLADAGAISYRELAARADAVFDRADAPRARALVAVEADNGVAAVAGYLGALRKGYPVLLTDSRLAPELRTALYDHHGIGWVWSAAGAWTARGGAGPATHPDLALLLSTSGSTGAAKLVKLTLAALQANAASIAAYLAITAAERPITTLPIHYSFGMSVLNSHLTQGAALLLTNDSITSKAFWDFCKAGEATSLAGVPTTFTLLRQLRFERMALPALRTLTQAGGRLADEHVAYFGQLAQARGARFVVMYGQTEAGPRMAYVPAERVLDKPGSIGIAIPGGRLDLVGDDGAVIEEAGVVGELRYTGPNVMMGYAEGPDALALPDVQHGVLMTGDLAERDADGFLYVRGRRTRFIKVFGNRIGLDDVELQLRARGHDVAVTGRDDLLVVALRGAADGADGAADSAADRTALAAEVAATYQLHHSAIRVARVDEFPLSSAGKLRYAALLDSVLGTGATNTGATNTGATS